MPYGGTTPAQDTKIERCVVDLTNKGRDDIKFTESLSFSMGELKIDEEKRLVQVCALAPCVSRNNRFYSPKVIEKALGTLTGKKSFADHDERNTKNLVGRIVSESLENSRLYAHIRFSKSEGIAKETLEKIKDGTITDVSIAADGKTRPMKLGERVVGEVYDLDIKSVDFVTEGGVPEAKVLQTFENVKDIPAISEVKDMEITDVKSLRENFANLVSEVEKPLLDKIATLESEKVERELKEHKESEISKLETKDSVKAILRERVVGKTKEEISTSITSELAYMQKVLEAEKPVAKIEGVSDVNRNKVGDAPKAMSSSTIRESKDIPDNLKGEVINMLWDKGQEAAKSFLKANKIEWK